MLPSSPRAAGLVLVACFGLGGLLVAFVPRPQLEDFSGRAREGSGVALEAEQAGKIDHSPLADRPHAGETSWTVAPGSFLHFEAQAPDGATTIDVRYLLEGQLDLDTRNLPGARGDLRLSPDATYSSRGAEFLPAERGSLFLGLTEGGTAPSRAGATSRALGHLAGGLVHLPLSSYPELEVRRVSAGELWMSSHADPQLVDIPGPARPSVSDGDSMPPDLLAALRGALGANGQSRGTQLTAALELRLLRPEP